MAASCESDVAARSIEDAKMCDSIKAHGRSNAEAGRSPAGAPDEAAWAKLEEGLRMIAQEVHRRAPSARLIFIDYIQIVPTRGSCARLPLSEKGAAVARSTAIRLTALTADIAHQAGAGLITASKLSRGHDVCASIPWASGFSRPANAATFAPYHPNLAAMTGIAAALDSELGAR